MASFDTTGLDALIIDLDEIGNIPDNVTDDMLEAGGEVIRKAHVEAIKNTFGKVSGRLEISPVVRKKETNRNHGIGSGNFRAGADTKYVLVYPEGEHHTYNARAKTYTKMNWGKPKTTTKGRHEKEATNQDVAFVHEFGGHGNAATQWMRETNEKHADEAVEAEFAVFDEWQKSHNL